MLFVDIDGVISLWGFDPRERPDGIWTLVDGIPHLLAAEAAQVLVAVAPLFECVWCSGWEEKANEYLPRLLGLGPWPFLRLDRPAGTRHRAGTSVRAHWKLAAVEDYAAGRRLAWIDDAVSDDVRTWASSREPPALLVETSPASGLTHADGRRLRTFAQT